jgi:hypothetical protein
MADVMDTVINGYMRLQGPLNHISFTMGYVISSVDNDYLNKNCITVVYSDEVTVKIHSTSSASPWAASWTGYVFG